MEYNSPCGNYYLSPLILRRHLCPAVALVGYAEMIMEYYIM